MSAICVRFDENPLFTPCLVTQHHITPDYTYQQVRCWYKCICMDHLTSLQCNGNSNPRVHIGSKLGQFARAIQIFKYSSQTKQIKHCQIKPATPSIVTYHTQPSKDPQTCWQNKTIGKINCLLCRGINLDPTPLQP